MRILQRGQSEWRCKAHTGFEMDRRDANLGRVRESCLSATQTEERPRTSAFGVSSKTSTLFRACWAGNMLGYADVSVERFSSSSSFAVLLDALAALSNAERVILVGRTFVIDQQHPPLIYLTVKFQL